LYSLYKNTKVITISKSTKNELINLGIKKPNITIIYSGVNNYQYKTPKSKTPLGLYVGRTKKYKRIELIISAVENMKSKIKNLKILIVGRGNDLPRLKKTVNDKNLNKYIKFMGFIDEKTKIQLLGKAWFNIQPSIKEGWGFTVLEAAKCKTPSIIANVSGLKETVINNKTGWFFSSQIELERLIIKLLNNKSLCEKAGRQAEVFSKKFDWTEACDKFAKLINK
jgi:glycosyltransferase involved in cell wall biosynthesis